MTLRFATFNLRYGTAEDGENAWSERRELVVECIQHMAPAVLCVQECLPFQSDELKANLPHFDHFGRGRYHGVATPKPHEGFSGEHCSVFFDTEVLLLERCGTFWHSETPETPGSISWDNKMPRITTWGILQSRQEETRLAIFNTHYGFGAQCVRRSTELMLARIPALSQDLPAIVAGDFNLTPDSSEHHMYQGLLTDVWAALGQSETGAGTGHGFTGVPNKRIDWIMTHPEATPMSVEKVTWSKEGRYPSDHFPVLAVLDVGTR